MFMRNTGYRRSLAGKELFGGKAVRFPTSKWYSTYPKYRCQRELNASNMLMWRGFYCIGWARSKKDQSMLFLETKFLGID
ncbi:MAG: hypothetical protein ACI8ZB_001283 [Desulforhopalus sp.]|jgi:hypothetical protein